MILTGDVGGTKTRVALFEEQAGALSRVQTKTYISSSFPGLEEILSEFLSQNRAEVRRSCFGVPGPVLKGKASATNLPWEIDQRSLSDLLGTSSVSLVNDLVCTAAAVPHLQGDQLSVLHPGLDGGEESFAALLAPGTGLGQAFLDMRGTVRVLPSEGGHVDFAPTSDLQIVLLKHLRTKFGRISYERVLSGPGLVNLYEFLRETGHAPEQKEVGKQLACGDPAEVISTFGLRGADQLCARSLDLFVEILGSQAGNLALTMTATRGVYLGGGIPPKIISKLRDERILSSYWNKGRLSELVRQTPLYVIMDDHAALIGAAHLATSS
jgi:glucokinase